MMKRENTDHYFVVTPLEWTHLFLPFFSFVRAFLQQIRSSSQSVALIGMPPSSNAINLVGDVISPTKSVP